MEPLEEQIDAMLTTAKILSRLFMEGHISAEELVTMQTALMKPAPQPVFLSSPYYTPPNPINILGGNGTFHIDVNNPFAGIGVLNSDDSNANYLVLK